jgi:hypothetical protein
VQDLSALDALERVLSAANAAALDGLDLGELSLLEEELPRLRVWAGSGQGLEEVDEEGVATAARGYRETGAFEGIGHARLLCYGCMREIDGKRLIEEPARRTARNE